MKTRHVMLLLAAVTLAACETPRPHAEAIGTASTLYYHGDILTMDGPAPAYVEAIVVNDGKIVFAGSRARAQKVANGALTEIDLEGRTLLPGFVDAESGPWGTDADELTALARVDRYAEAGYTTVRASQTSKAATETWRRLAGQNRIEIDLAVYPDVPSELKYMKMTFTTRAYARHFRVAGVKLNVDAIHSAADRDALLTTAFERHWQVIAECHEDAAADELMDAVAKAATTYGNNDRRTILIPARVDPDVRIDRTKALGIIQAHRISPAPQPNALMLVHSSVNRPTDVDAVSPDDQVSPYISLKSVTEWAAYQYFEESSKGTLTPGKLADFVILDRNPLKVAPETIKDIEVVETIKEGKTVFKK